MLRTAKSGFYLYVAGFMIKLCKPIYCAFLLLFVLTVVVVCGEAEDHQEDSIVTHADAAFMFAKYSGLFDRYVGRDADLSECVSFLNEAGIYFGFLEIATGVEFKVEDCARAMGQAELVFSGRAEFVGGKVKLPDEVLNWEEYCNLNRIKYVHGYESMKELLRLAKQKNR